MKKNRGMSGKLSLILCLFIGSLIGLGTRVWYIKAVHGQEYEMKAKTQQVNSIDITISPNRGSIVDRNKQAFAVSTTVYNIVLDPLLIAELDDSEQAKKTLSTLSETLGIDLNELNSYITIDPATGKPTANTHYKVIAKKQDRQVKEALEEKGLNNSTGVFYEKDTKRRYTLDTVAASTLGFIRGDTKWGLEAEYDEELSGKSGRTFITYDGSTNASIQEIPAEDGNTIVTTLDYTLQQYAEQSVQEIMNSYNPKNASTIIMDPNTGEILAMAAGPTYNNNVPSEPLALANPEFKALWEQMDDAQMFEYLNNTWKNFNISDTYEPGSIFKPMVVAAALEENVISTSSTYYCGGRKQVYDRDIGCWLRSGHGNETLEDLLKNSCNVGMMDVGEKLGGHLLYKYQKDFGFGSLTGIDLPGEVSASSLLYSEDKIGPVELATMSFGQSFNCTSLQAINAFCATINGGNLMKPYVVSQVLDQKGNVLKENKPSVVRKVISKETSDIVRRYMKSVVDSGTGKKARVDGYDIGGKTGTAEQANRDDELYTVTFIGFLPVENPQYVALVVIDKSPTYVEGSTSAAPVMQTLFKNIIKYKNIEPNYQISGSTEVKTKAGKVTVEDYTNQSMIDTSSSLAGKNLDYEVVGTGNIVTNQVPKGGTEVDEGSKIILYVKKAEGDTGTIAIPDVKGLTSEEAIKQITDAGLGAVLSGDEEGNVVSQQPNPGIMVEEGSEVTITLEAVKK